MICTPDPVSNVYTAGKCKQTPIWLHEHKDFFFSKLGNICLPEFFLSWIFKVQFQNDFLIFFFFISLGHVGVSFGDTFGVPFGSVLGHFGVSFGVTFG